MFYYLSETETEGVNAGNKARNDVEKILKKRNDSCAVKTLTLGKEMKHGNRVRLFIKTQFYWRKIKKISQNSIIFILQFSLSFYHTFSCRCLCLPVRKSCQ